MGRYKILLFSLPMALAVAATKVLFHALGWEPIGAAVLPFFTAALTCIVFLLGFILAGVMTDYKESEKIPGEMASTLYALWLEAESAARGSAGGKARTVQRGLVAVVTLFRSEVLLRRRDEQTLVALDALVDDVVRVERDLAPPLVARLHGEMVNLRRLIMRIRVIRDTSFSVSVSVLAKGIVALFVMATLLLRFEQEFLGMFFAFFYSFLLLSILRVIGDMDDPFEYVEGRKPVDEIDFFPVFEFENEMLRKLSSIPAPDEGRGDPAVPPD